MGLAEALPPSSAAARHLLPAGEGSRSAAPLIRRCAFPLPLGEGGRRPGEGWDWPRRCPYAQLKGNWSSMKNGKPLFHHVLQCVSCWKKELPDGDCRQGRRDYTKCPGTRSRGTWAGDRCYPTASKVHRRQLVADARPDSAQKT